MLFSLKKNSAFSQPWLGVLFLKVIIFKTLFVNKSIFVRCPDLASNNKVVHAYMNVSLLLIGGVVSHKTKIMGEFRNFIECRPSSVLAIRNLVSEILQNQDFSLRITSL